MAAGERTDELRTWIAAVAGGTVTRVERTSWGESRETSFVDVELPSGETLELVLRRDTGAGPVSGTELSLAREAAVYRALAGSDVPMPRLHGVNEEHEALLLDRSPGREDLTTIVDSDEREAVAADYVRALVALHDVDPGTLELPGFARPSTPEEHALLDLELWERIYAGRVKRPEPLFRFAFGWLRRNAPRVVDRTVLCHGDVGPGNFLFDRGRVTAMLDWEFAHLGDPMDDLAWLTIRGQLLSFGDLATNLSRYAELTGRPVDAGRVQYYRGIVLLRMAVACLAGLDAPNGAMGLATYFNMLPVLRRFLCQVLAELAGAPLEPAEVPAPGPGTAQSEVIEAVLADVGNVVLPALTEPATVKRATGMYTLLLHLQAVQRMEPALSEAELDDMAGVLGRRPASVREGLEALDGLASSAGPARDAELIAYFSRQTDRILPLWPAVAPFAATPLTPL